MVWLKFSYRRYNSIEKVEIIRNEMPAGLPNEPFYRQSTLFSWEHWALRARQTNESKHFIISRLKKSEILELERKNLLLESVSVNDTFEN